MEKNKEKIYEKHQREYTIVGSTSIMGAIIGREVMDFFGGQLSEVISVVKDGVYYHFQIEGEREAMAKCFVRRFDQGKVDLESEYKKFDTLVSEYEEFIAQDSTEFTKEIVLKLFEYYNKLMPVALACLDAVEVLGGLNKQKQEELIAWAQKTRRREEVIYKNGEMKFMPRYLEWLAANYLPAYKVDDLKYLIYIELEQWIKQNKSLPTVGELRNRKELLFVRQYPIRQIEFSTADQAAEEISKRKLFVQTVDKFIEMRELKGKTAFPGKVQGRVRLIRSRVDMKYFKDGEIIVAPMTEPAYLPIMKHAKAFVTNEGGDLCHAAIVSRELQKPCIIGTKHATHVFRDGDLIEVDAEKGVVRKI